MFEDRAPDPIARLGPTRDRPFEATHFDRVEAGRRASDHPPPRRRAPAAAPAGPRRQTSAAPADVTPSPDDPPRIGTHLDVRA
jgi:hypothetical protein